MKKTLGKKLLSITIIFTLLMQMFSFNVFAAEPFVDNRVVDASTMTDWQNYFGDSVRNTENAGGVWGDKSVFKSAEDFNAALEAGVQDYNIPFESDGTNFLVSLSAIAANKSIIGYSALPTDTVFVLDLSNSMSNDSVSSMVTATNNAIATLLELNRNNRFGVIVYSGGETGQGGFFGSSDIFGLEESATVLIPLGRYQGTGNNNSTFLNYNNDTVSVARGVLSLGNNQRTPSKRAEGATYIQSGIQLAIDQFNAVEDTVITSGPQAGTVRMPVMVLMSDGAPTVATTSFNDVGNSTHGSGSSSSTTSTFLTQLSCAFARKEMADKYGRAALLYTLGLNVGNSSYAKAVLNPSNAGTPYSTYWTSYQNAVSAGSSTVTIRTDSGYNSSSFTVPVVSGLESNYVDQYFSATGDTGLINAFRQIVNQIIIQSKYYPTLVDDGQHHLDGYITFTDELGLFMEVRDIKGLTVDGNLYSGYSIVRAIKNGTFGNIYNGNLSNLNDDGVVFLEAVQERLGCNQSQAGEIVSQALRSGQLYYNSNTDFSNYIGWYADADGNFLGFWNGKDHSSKPANAVYANKSYGYLGKVGSAEEFNETDMLHISVQVREHIEKQHQMVIYKIPAALIPTVNYNITFDGDSLETGTDFEMSIDGANEALRLIFEVGLRSDINRINLAAKVAEYEELSGESYPYVNDGVYTFYSNSWHEHTHQANVLVDSHDATFFDFEPSLENERYYYTSNSPILESDGNGGYSEVDHDPRNTSATYYTAYAVFSTVGTSTSSATLEYHYVPIHEDTISLAQNINGVWFIPKNTVHKLIVDSTGQDYHILKDGQDITTTEKTHPTKTLNYSNYPSVVFLADGTIHCDACLGNNGTFSMTAAQGIKLSKTVSVEGLGAGQKFTFNIALTAPLGTTLASTYPLYDADGIYIDDVNVNNNIISVELSPGQTVFIADLPEGTEYTVAEEEISGWAVASSSGTTGTISANTFSDVSFENTPALNGNLVISKTVVLPTALGNSASYTEPFDVEVTFTSTAPIESVKVNNVDTPVTDNKLPLTIKDGESILITGIPKDTSYDVTEPGLPSFWSSSLTKSRDTISTTETAVAALTNTYSVSQVLTVNINHIGIKNVIGREWIDDDYYQFRLEMYDGSNWVAFDEPDELQTVTQDTADKNFSFNDIISGLSFDKVGTYQFRIVELYTDIDGIDYDYLPKRFDVVVENNFDTGKLEITNISTTTPMPDSTNDNPTPAGTTIEKVTEDGADTYNITTVFNNLYSVSGTAEIVINIDKELVNNTGIARDESGFEFELYQLDGNNQKINVESLGTTDSTGVLSYTKSFGADFVGQALVYYIAEVDSGEDGMQYDTTPRKIEITIVDNLDGSVSAKIGDTDSNTFSDTFTNTYSLTSAPVEITASKVMDGRDLTPEDISALIFELYSTDSNFENESFIMQSQITDGVISFNFTEDTAGTKYYIVKEKASGIKYVVDDTSIFCVTVDISKGEGDALVSELVSIEKNNEEAEKIEFVNIYNKPAPDSLYFSIEGIKILEGRELVDGEFSFILRSKSGYPLQTKAVENGMFKFDMIRYRAPGEYTYTVEEVRGNANGITYDDTVYTVIVTVKEVDGKLVATTSISTDSENNLDSIVFTNTYSPSDFDNPKPPVDTSDNSRMILWSAVFLASTAAVFAPVIIGKKKSKV